MEKSQSHNLQRLPVRRLLINLEPPIERHWNGGDAFRSAFLNALSMSFPRGEQFFMDSVRSGLAHLPPTRREEFAQEVSDFVGQEATHRRIHSLFNAHLTRLGYQNKWEPRIERRLWRLQSRDVRAHVGFTAAAEHFTAILAEYFLERPAVFASQDERLNKLWLWHASEEAEHSSTAFDLYQALGGSQTWRSRLFKLATWYFVSDALLQTARNLQHDGLLLRSSTWASAREFFFGKEGLVRHCFGPWRAYLKPDFHPSQLISQRSTQWLASHQEDFVLVRS